jgi:type II secretory pathway component PulJ
VSSSADNVRATEPRGVPRSTESGFSLLELVVAGFILLVALTLANQLLVESQRRIAVSVRELREPEDVLALRLLREDLRASAPIYGSGAVPLECTRPGMTARWEWVEDRLERRVFDETYVDQGARVMLDQIVAFRWRTIVPGAVEVEIVRRRPKIGGALRAGSERWRPVAETLESVRLVGASRTYVP